MGKLGWYVVGLVVYVGLGITAMAGSELAAVLALAMTLLVPFVVPTRIRVEEVDHYEDTDHYQDRTEDGTPVDDDGDPYGDADRDADGEPGQRPGRDASAISPTRTVVCSNCDQPVSPDNENCELCSSVGTWRK